MISRKVQINVYALYAYHYRCELSAFVSTYIIKYMNFSLLFTLTKRVCQLCRDNCSQIQHILSITLNFLVRLIIVSRGEWLGNAATFKRLAYCFDFDAERGSHVTLKVQKFSRCWTIYLCLAMILR